ncbi:MAG: FG-GAP repeat domain-containing protein, partial [Acidobacteriota bacterium]
MSPVQRVHRHFIRLFYGLLALTAYLLTAPPREHGPSVGPAPWGVAQASSCDGLCFTNATLSAEFNSLDNYGGHGIQVVDVNADGWLDVYVTHIGDPSVDRPDLLFINEGVNPPRFEEMGATLGVSDDGFFEEMSEESHGAIFADFDNDGDFDLFNVHTWNGHNRLYRNDGEGRFTDLSESSGIEVTRLGSRGVTAADMNGDGLLDIVVSAWEGAQPIIYWNQDHLHFERRRLKGVDNRPFANQGITSSDYDGDGLPDLALTAFEFIENQGFGPIALLKNAIDRFVDMTDFASLGYEKLSSTGG